MAVTWTEDQQKVISLRNRNILVSAAAGSGKTAVLVQRILSKIMDREHPVDIDRLLIMTFTRAAAGEMKERISRALEAALMEDPDNEHLQRQMTLIHTAQITTIDGFCSYIIRNYFHIIGLDPGYRTAEEGELKLLKGDVLKELIEDYHQKGDGDFQEFVECYASGKTEDGVKELILKVYDAAMSHPDPREWLERCLETYRISTVEELREASWMELLWKGLQEDLSEAEELLEKAREICVSPGGPYLYEEAVESDLLFLGQLRAKAEERDFDQLAALLAKPSFARLSGKKMQDVEPAMKEEVKALREEAKDLIRELGSRYFHATMDQILELLTLCRGPMETLVQLVLDFMERFGEKKREKNLLDFTDMEHFALEILRRGEAETGRDTGRAEAVGHEEEKKGDVEKGDAEKAGSGKTLPGPEKRETVLSDDRLFGGKERMTWQGSTAARELSEKYDEVLVDEYQDSNLVQEFLTNLVSGWVDGRKNIFMVGDVKQSIYRFRLARPELFMEKYRTYSLEDSSEQRIDLHKNFRSRAQVLNGVNYIFRQIMGEDLGGITYDDDAALYPGAVFPDGANESFLKTEILLVEKDGEELEESSQNARELEALAIAQKIRKIVGTEKVMDAGTHEYRTVEYGDIVILLRTSAGWAETFSQVLSSQGIPSYAASRTGYFSALEVVTVLNFLRVCDNPLQDIPLAGVLRSPIVGCTAQELGILRGECPKGLLYDSVCAFVEDGQLELFPQSSEKERLKEKLKGFLALLKEMRDLSAFTPIHQLILLVLEKTGYGDYARALPDGQQRSGNLHMLVEKAMDYEKTSYRGLFHFIRYIENLQKYEVDFGEVNLSGAGSSSVQIMTIHKSKGLEFPIVFVAGMGKQFNFQDINARLLIHPELGFGADAILPEKRLIVSALHKQMIRRELLKESLGEELRVLYVALTRAKEKLILTGTVGNLEKLLRQISRYQGRKEQLLPVGMRLKAKNYWSFVLPALAGHRCMEELYREFGIGLASGYAGDEAKDRLLMESAEGGVSGRRLCGDEAEFEVRRITASDMVAEAVISQTDSQLQEEILKSWDCEKVFDAEIRGAIEERFGFLYPYGYLREIPAKVSVSELKKRSYKGEDEQEEGIFWEPDVVPLIPQFVEKKEEEYTGAARGTAYHRVMECLDYGKVSSAEEVEEQIAGLVLQKKLSQKERDSIRREDIMKFVESPLGQRMGRAALDGKLRREQPFVISVPASALDERWKGGETVLVQGIIDAYFIEDGEIVLVDYKTDRVAPGEGQRLVELYHVQLEDYAAALERMLKVKVKEKKIYSFTLGEEITV